MILMGAILSPALIVMVIWKMMKEIYAYVKIIYIGMTPPRNHLKIYSRRYLLY